MRIAFDVDGTLIDFNDRPRRQVVAVLLTLARAGHDIVVWSGGGADYAEMVGRRIGLPESITYLSKFPASLPHADIAFDDEKDTLMADQMFIVGRYR